MSGLYLHSPKQACGKDYCCRSPNTRKAEPITIRGKNIVACVHTTENLGKLNSKSLNYLAPNTRIVQKSPSKTVSTHASECKKDISLTCPYPRCETKMEDSFKHFISQHDFVRIGLNIPVIYRLKNIIRDRFVLFEPNHEIFLIGNIEENYQKYINFEMQIIYDYKKKCCGHRKFTFTIEGVVQNAAIEIYKNKHTIGKSLRKIEILKDKLKNTTEMKTFYDLEITIRRA
ncbi:hypothetical protein HHI36_003393 [Cryptolaemus montrouzieri]|uniref:Uncharacterized protein n=1 Tax=Cryptolaemus montrouzieri TaxID=559131 RepID=A0ABD2PD95_9CUCU